MIGAVIGYATNDIAIRMLFRPLKEVRVFGLHVPFTPGIFPKERYKLARSIGKMVSRELITEDALMAQIHHPAAQAQLARTVSSLSERILALPLSSLTGEGMSSIADAVSGGVEGILRKIFVSPALMNGVRGAITGIVATISGKRPAELLGQFDLKSLVTERLLPLLADPARRATLARDLATVVADSAGGLVTDEVIAGLAAAVEHALPSAGERVAQWLQSAETRQLLSERGRELLPRILDKLNVVQRLLLSAGQFDRRLAEKMPEIVDDTVRSLQEVARDPSQQKRVLAVGLGALRDWRDAVRGSTAVGSAASGLREGLEPLIARALVALEDPAVRARVYGSLEAWIASGHQTVGGLLRSTFGLQESQVVDFVAERVMAWLTGDRAAPQAAGALSGLVSRFLADNGGTTLRDLGQVDAARKEKLDTFLVTRLVEVVDRHLPEILRGIDVEDLVVKKIDGLDVRDVERLLVQVIASHLKWINVFGAILGFIIGLFQLILRVLGIA